MSKSYIVSSHGGAWKGNMFSVPRNVTIHFYVDHGEILKDHDAWNFLRDLRAGKTPTSTVTENAGAWIPKYYCWNYPEIGRDCGVFRIRKGAGKLKIDLGKYTGQEPLSLMQLIEDLRNGHDVIIHWLACTSTITRI